MRRSPRPGFLSNDTPCCQAGARSHWPAPATHFWAEQKPFAFRDSSVNNHDMTTKRKPSDTAVLLPTELLDRVERMFLDSIADPREREVMQTMTAGRRSHGKRVQYILLHWCQARETLPAEQPQ